MIKKLSNLLGIPALFIHELSHILCVVILGAKGNGVEITGDLSDFEVSVHYETNSNWKKNVISMAPIGGFIIWSIAIMFTSGLIFLTLALYTLIYVRVFFPSKIDIDTYNTKQENINTNYEVPDLI